MVISRRTTLLTGGAALILAACGAPPATLTVSASASNDANPGPDSSPRPLTVTLIQMTGTTAFDAADVYALQDPQAALGSEFAGASQISLAPGGSGSATLAIKPGVTTVGIVAGYRDSTGKTFRQKIAAPSKPEAISVIVGPDGVSLA